MGIINRIKNITSSYLINEKSNSENSIIDDEDILLRKKIDEISKNSNEFKQNKTSEKMDIYSKMSLEQAAQVLGVNINDELNIIESAYKIKIKEYHPDLVSRMGDEIRQLAAKRTLEINLAYDILKKSKDK